MDLIWIASYPRSGNTWMRFLLSAYIYGAPEQWTDQNRIGSTIHYLMEDGHRRGQSMEEIGERFARFAAKHPREPGFPPEPLVKTHWVCSESHPFIERTRSAICLIRNPRDVALSAMNYLRFWHPSEPAADGAVLRDFAEIGGLRLWTDRGYGSWAEQVDSWLGASGFPVLGVRFEDLKADPGAELRRVLAFIGAPIDGARVERAVESTSASRLGALESQAVEAQLLGDVDRSRKFIKAAAPERAGASSIEEVDRELSQRFRERMEEPMARHGYVWPAEA